MQIHFYIFSWLRALHSYSARYSPPRRLRSVAACEKPSFRRQTCLAPSERTIPRASAFFLDFLPCCPIVKFTYRYDDSFFIFCKYCLLMKLYLKMCLYVFRQAREGYFYFSGKENMNDRQDIPKKRRTFQIRLLLSRKRFAFRGRKQGH